MDTHIRGMEKPWTYICPPICPRFTRTYGKVTEGIVETILRLITPEASKVD